MKKFLIALALAFGLLSLSAGAASATPGGGGGTPAENKQVTFCHATAVPGKYEKITTSLNAFINAGHVDHVQGGQKDIYEAITYTTKAGDVVTIPAQGNTALLAFEDCAEPKVDTKIAKPEVVYVDKCGTKDDVFSVAPGTGYTVGPVVTEGLSQSITVTANEGFVFTDGTKSVRYVKPAFTDVDCDLPETGAGATFNKAGGFGALGAMLLGGIAMLTAGRRKVTA